MHVNLDEVPEVVNDKVLELEKKLTKNKALAPDGFPNTYLKVTARGQYVCLIQLANFLNVHVNVYNVFLPIAEMEGACLTSKSDFVRRNHPLTQ